MANYLLLRDNKETGPYSLDDLLDIGLKPYDLVWIQGKSAAWRYPSEVEELKAYASASEEQPFDRFFKRDSVEKNPVLPAAKNEPLAFKKAVFVTMPSSKKETANAEGAVTIQPENIYQRVQTITVTENPVSAEIKFEQPLEEIKEMYVKTLQQRKQKIARKNIFFKTLKRASVFIYVLALGVLIGFTLKSKSSKKNIAEQQISSMQSSDATQTPLSTSASGLSTDPQGITAKTTQEQPSKEIKENSRTIFEKPTVEKKSSRMKTDNASNTSEKKEINSDQNPPGTDVNAITGERTKKSRGNGDVTTASSKEDISKLVSVKSNDYKRGVFGGIHDLQLTVMNDSKYVLDNVIVALQYLKPSEQPLKTENISFQSVAPNGSLTIAIPAFNRGVKVAFKVVKIESKQLHDETAGL